MYLLTATVGLSVALRVLWVSLTELSIGSHKLPFAVIAAANNNNNDDDDDF